MLRTLCVHVRMCRLAARAHALINKQAGRWGGWGGVQPARTQQAVEEEAHVALLLARLATTCVSQGPAWAAGQASRGCLGHARSDAGAARVQQSKPRPQKSPAPAPLLSLPWPFAPLLGPAASTASSATVSLRARDAPTPMTSTYWRSCSSVHRHTGEQLQCVARHALRSVSAVP